MIICAALRIKDIDTVIGCWRHGFGFSALHDLKPELSGKDIEQGFLDNQGRFLDRKDAYYHALDCGQLSASTRQLKRERNEDELYSEDLY